MRECRTCNKCKKILAPKKKLNSNGLCIKCSGFHGLNNIERKIICTALYDSQNGKCAICKIALEDKSRLDHRHEPYKLRGLLCFSCNIGLGMFKDNTKILLEAIFYLNRYK